MRLPMATTFAERARARHVHGTIRLADERDIFGWTRWRYVPGDQDRGWDWWSIWRECALSNGRYECYAAVVGPDVHGLMVLVVAGRESARTRRLTVEYLATNPVNRRAGQGLKHVGSALLGTAIMRSLETGMHGQLWLESLSGAEEFYGSLGFRKLPGASDDGYARYTLSKGRANALLKIIKERGILLR